MAKQNKSAYVGKTTGLSTISFDPYLDYNKFRLKSKKITKEIGPQNMGRRYQCPFVEKNKPKCLWSFDKKAHLDRHMTSHYEVGVYVCQMCNSTSKYNYNVYDHWRSGNCKVFHPEEFTRDHAKIDIKVLIRLRMERLGRLSEFHLHEGCVFILNPNFLMDCLEYLGDSHNETCNVCNLSFNVIYKNFHRDVHFLRKRIDDSVLQDAYFCSLCSIGVESQEELYNHWRFKCEPAMANGSQNDLTNEELAALAFTIMQQSIPIEYYYSKIQSELEGRQEYVRTLKKSPNIAQVPNNELYYYTGALCINESRPITNDKIFNNCIPLDSFARTLSPDEKSLLYQNRENALATTFPNLISESGYWERVCGPNSQIKTVFVYSADDTVLPSYKFTQRTEPGKNSPVLNLWCLQEHAMPCEICKMLFSREGNLMKHYEFHTAEMFCVLCKSQFNTVEIMETHWKTSCSVVSSLLSRHVRQNTIKSEHMRILIVAVAEMRQKCANDLDALKIWIDAFAEWLLTKDVTPDMDEVRDVISKLEQNRIHQLNQIRMAAQVPPGNYQNVLNAPIQQTIQRPQYQQPQRQIVGNVQQRPTSAQNVISQKANPRLAPTKVIQPTIDQQRQQQDTRGLGIRNVPVQSFYKQSKEKATRLNLDSRQLQLQQLQNPPQQEQQLQQMKQLQPKNVHKKQPQQQKKLQQQQLQAQKLAHQPRTEQPQRPQHQNQQRSETSQMGTSSLPTSSYFNPPENTTVRLVKLTNSSFYQCIPNHVVHSASAANRTAQKTVPIPETTSQLNTSSHPVVSQTAKPVQRQYVYRIGNKRPAAENNVQVVSQPPPKKVNVGTQTPMVDVMAEFEKFKAEYNKKFDKLLNDAVSKYETPLATVPDNFMNSHNKQPAKVPLMSTPIHLRAAPVPIRESNLPLVKDVSQVPLNDCYYANLDTYVEQPDYSQRGRFNVPPVFSSEMTTDDSTDDTPVNVMIVKELIEKNRKTFAPSNHCLYDTTENIEMRNLSTIPEYVQADDAVLKGCTAITYFPSGEHLTGGYLLKDMDDYEYWVVNPTHKQLPVHGEHLEVNDNNVIVRCIALNVIHEEEGIILLFPYSSFTACFYKIETFPLLYSENPVATIPRQQTSTSDEPMSEEQTIDVVI